MKGKGGERGRKGKGGNSFLQSQGEVSRINTEPAHSMISRKGARSPLGQKRVKGACPAFLKSEYFTSLLIAGYDTFQGVGYIS